MGALGEKKNIGPTQIHC